MSDEIAKAEALVRELEAKKAEHIAACEKLEAERSAIAFDALTKGGKSHTRLDEITTTLAKRASKTPAFDSAIAQAKLQVVTLQEAKAAAEARAKEAAAIKLMGEIGEAATFIDRHFADVARGLIALNHGVNELHDMGFAHPSHVQVRLSVVRAIKTWAMKLPDHWRRDLSRWARTPATEPASDRRRILVEAFQADIIA